ncbi:MAG: ParA family protein [Bacteroidota bacterium]
MIFSIFNHKGGTGKTTTTINLGYAVAQLGYKVLLIDFDLQANLSYTLGARGIQSLESVLEAGDDLFDYMLTDDNLSLLPNTRVDLNQGHHLSSSFLLANALPSLRDHFDFIFIDCPPTISDHTVNALCASDYVLVPFQLEVLCVQGLNQVITSVSQIKEAYGSGPEIFGVVPVMVDIRRSLSTEIYQHIKTRYEIDIFNSYVRTNVKVAEAPSFGKSVIQYAPFSAGSMDYTTVAQEFIQKVEQKSLTPVAG